LKYLLESLVDCAATLKSVNIQDNKSINKAIPELTKVIEKCHNLEYLNISDLKMSKKNCMIIQQAFTNALKPGYKLRELEWNYDLAVSPSTAKIFLGNLANNLQDCL
jgi:Ran GTPase-activating protein (RanGAP) involved in mRNA processing and transport